MVTEAEIEKYIQPILDRQVEINRYVVGVIAERVKEIGTLLPSDLHRLERLYKSGADVRKINKEIARLTGLQVKDIKKLIRDLAYVQYYELEPYYDYRHKPFIPFAQNIELQKVVRAVANQTAMTFLNISKAQGFMLRDPVTRQLKMTPLSQAYQQVIDKAIQATQQGTVDYNTAMRNTMKELNNSGIRRVAYESEKGKKFTQRLDTAVRRNILDGVRAINQGVQDITGQQFGADGKEMSVHLNPAPDHEALQGHQYTNEQFEKMQNVEPFEDVDGKKYAPIERAIGTLNCRHFMYSIIIGFSKQNYNNKQLAEIIKKNHDGYTTSDGKHMTMYECTQYQRQLETKIRYAKDGQMMALKCGDRLLAEYYQTRVSKLTKKYNAFSKACGLSPKSTKMRVSGYRRISLKKGA